MKKEEFLKAAKEFIKDKNILEGVKNHLKEIQEPEIYTLAELPKQNLEIVIGFLNDEIKYVLENGYRSKDFDHYCYETLIDCFVKVPKVWYGFGQD